MNKREARKVALRIAANRCGLVAQEAELSKALRKQGFGSSGVLGAEDSRLVNNALAHLAEHHTWEADGRPRR